MATLLSARDDQWNPDPAPKSHAGATRELTSGLGQETPFCDLEVAKPSGRLAKPVPGTRYLALEPELLDETTSPGYVHGVSLYSVLQMLHLERKTCILEVVAEHRFGTITLVNGELVDADVDGREGESAVYRILTWQQPQTTIMDGVSLFRHTVDLPIAQLLVESVRLQDEAADTNGRTSSAESGDAFAALASRFRLASENQARIEDWNWLVETLIIGGAKVAAVIRARDERVLAIGDEFGGLATLVDGEAFSELASICRSARRWSRLVDRSISEMVLRIGDDQILIAPIDLEKQVFAHVRVNANDSLEFVRGAIRSVIR